MKSSVYVITVILGVFSPASAHDSEQWIADGHMVDPVSKAWCCGPIDCAPLASSEVKEVPGGYEINQGPDFPPEFIPESRTLPFSPDGRYHRCIGGDESTMYTRCFITPPRSA